MVSDVYARLSEKIGVVGYPRYIKILEREMTPEEQRFYELTKDLLQNPPEEEQSGQDGDDAAA